MYEHDCNGDTDKRWMDVDDKDDDVVENDDDDDDVMMGRYQWYDNNLASMRQCRPQ